MASSTAMWFMFMVGSIVIFYESESGIASSRSIFMNQYDTIVCEKKGFYIYLELATYKA